MAPVVQLRVRLLDYSSVNPLLVEDNSLKADKESPTPRAEIKILAVVFWGSDTPVLIIQGSWTLHHLEHRKVPQTPNGIILQTTALSLSASLQGKVHLRQP